MKRERKGKTSVGLTRAGFGANLGRTRGESGPKAGRFGAECGPILGGKTAIKWLVLGGMMAALVGCGETADDRGIGRNDPTPTPAAVVSQAPATPSPTPTPAPEETAQTLDMTEVGGAGTVAGADYDYTKPVPESEAVEDDYFSDAAFIGDSRIEGLSLYGGLAEGDYITSTGMSVFQVDTREITYKGQKMKVLEALGQKGYKKVYISLGVNELGMHNDQGYYDHYLKLVQDVKAQQPDAIVYIQLLIPVNDQKCRESKIANYITNEQIEVYNELLYQIAEEEQVFLVDPAEVIVDPTTGEPPYDATGDGVHFYRSSYQNWIDYLKKHTICKGDL